MANTDGGRRNVVRLTDLNKEDVEFLSQFSHDSGSHRYHHIVIRIKETGETMTLEIALRTASGAYDPTNPYQFQAIEFADGTVLEWTELLSSGLLMVEGTDGDDTLLAPGTGGTLYGGAGDDKLYGGNGDDILYGGDGDDRLESGAGNDILDGGAGNDYLIGGKGNNTFIFGKGYGHDRAALVANTDGGRRNVVRLTDLNMEDVEFLSQFSHDSGSHRYHHIVIRIKETGETMTLEIALRTASGAYDPTNPYQFQAIEFADGTVLEWTELLSSGLLMVEGTDGDDKLYGGAGNDYLEGGAGDDIFVFSRGYGHDVVNAHGANYNEKDVLRLLGLGLDDVEFLAEFSKDTQYLYHHLVVRIKDTGETVTVQNALVSSLSNGQVYTSTVYERVDLEFGDGTTMSYADLLNSGLIKMEGTDGDDNLRGANFGVTMYGYEGNDTLYGGIGNDILYGGDGDDKLYGGAGNDILDGGAGNDYLEGGAGDDTYIFRAGGGQDTINNAGGVDDLLKFMDIDPAQLWFGQSGNHLIISLVGTQDQVTVNNWFHSAGYMIDTIEAGDSYITENQVALMVQAMAALGAPAGVGGDWTDEQREALTPMLSSYWQNRV